MSLERGYNIQKNSFFQLLESPSIYRFLFFCTLQRSQIYLNIYIYIYLQAELNKGSIHRINLGFWETNHLPLP